MICIESPVPWTVDTLDNILNESLPSGTPWALDKNYYFLRVWDETQEVNPLAIFKNTGYKPIQFVSSRGFDLKYHISGLNKTLIRAPTYYQDFKTILCIGLQDSIWLPGQRICFLSFSKEEKHELFSIVTLTGASSDIPLTNRYSSYDEDNIVPVAPPPPEPESEPEPEPEPPSDDPESRMSGLWEFIKRATGASADAEGIPQLVTTEGLVKNNMFVGDALGGYTADGTATSEGIALMMRGIAEAWELDNAPDKRAYLNFLYSSLCTYFFRGDQPSSDLEKYWDHTWLIHAGDPFNSLGPSKVP